VQSRPPHLDPLDEPGLLELPLQLAVGVQVHVLEEHGEGGGGGGGGGGLQVSILQELGLKGQK